MTVLLDTQAFYWLVHPAHDTPPHVAALLAGAARVWVSDISAFEVATKVRLGKFDDARFLVDNWQTALLGLRAAPLVVSTAHAIAAGSMPWPHRDPFDRLLVAQAQVEGLRLVTADRVMLGAPGIDVLPW